MKIMTKACVLSGLSIAIMSFGFHEWGMAMSEKRDIVQVLLPHSDALFAIKSSLLGEHAEKKRHVFPNKMLNLMGISISNVDMMFFSLLKKKILGKPNALSIFERLMTGGIGNKIWILDGVFSEARIRNSLIRYGMVSQPHSYKGFRVHVVQVFLEDKYEEIAIIIWHDRYCFFGTKKEAYWLMDVLRRNETADGKMQGHGLLTSDVFGFFTRNLLKHKAHALLGYAKIMAGEFDKIFSLKESNFLTQSEYFLVEYIMGNTKDVFRIKFKLRNSLQSEMSNKKLKDFAFQYLGMYLIMKYPNLDVLDNLEQMHLEITNRFVILTVPIFANQRRIITNILR